MGDGQDQLRDFDVSEDSLEFDFLYDPSAFIITDVAGGAEIQYGADMILLRNVDLNGLSPLIDPIDDGFTLTFI